MGLHHSFRSWDSGFPASGTFELHIRYSPLVSFLLQIQPKVSGNKSFTKGTALKCYLPSTAWVDSKTKSGLGVILHWRLVNECLNESQRIITTFDFLSFQFVLIDASGYLTRAWLGEDSSPFVVVSIPQRSVATPSRCFDIILQTESSWKDVIQKFDHIQTIIQVLVLIQILLS